MPQSSDTMQALATAALSASHVGTWEYDVRLDRLRCDAVTAKLYGLTPAEGAAGVGLRRIRDAVHPEDRPRTRTKHDSVLAHGGVFVIEYRVIPSGGNVRWVLVRGAFEVDADGVVCLGRGIVVDVTESKLEGFVEGSALFLPPPSLRRASLSDLADRAIDAGVIAAALDGNDGAKLRPLVDALLFGVGRQIAARLRPEDV